MFKSYAQASEAVNADDAVFLGPFHVQKPCFLTAALRPREHAGRMLLGESFLPSLSLLLETRPLELRCPAVLGYTTDHVVRGAGRDLGIDLQLDGHFELSRPLRC